MKNKLFTLGGILILCLGIFLINFISASDSLTDEKNISFEEQANICLGESRDILNELIYENFTVLRINDSLNQAENIFDAQVILKQKNKKDGFFLVLPYCEEIKTIKENAFEARDEFFALKIFYDELFIEGMNTTSIDEIVSEIENEIESERYEKVKSLVDKAYEEIINVKSDFTTLNIFYKTATRDLKKFLDENWIYVISSLIILTILFFIYKNTIFQGIIKWKMHQLEVRRGAIKGLIKINQHEYFNQGNISERTYTIKIKKFAELVRDIDRQIPLLQERLFKILRKQNPDKKLKIPSPSYSSQSKEKKLEEDKLIKEKQKFKEISNRKKLKQKSLIKPLNRKKKSFKKK